MDIFDSIFEPDGLSIRIKTMAKEDSTTEVYGVRGEENGFRPITIDIVKELWSKTYNTSGKPDWSHIFPYYHEDMVFQDTIQRIEGLESFKEMCQRLTSRTKELSMEIVTIAQQDDVIIFEWIMTMMFKKWPSTPLYGSTKLRISEDGRIIEQRDYYDLWGDIFNNIPRFGKMYRRFLRRRFG